MDDLTSPLYTPLTLDLILATLLLLVETKNAILFRKNGIRDAFSTLDDAHDTGVSRNDFWTFRNGNGNGSAHFQTLGRETGMINCIPKFWEREWG